MSAAAVSTGAAWRFDAIGAPWEIVTERPIEAALRDRVDEVIDRFDATWSRFRGDSSVSRLGGAGGEIDRAPDAGDMLDAYAELDAATAGAVNPLVGDALARRGYDAAYSFHDRGAVAAPSNWRELTTWSEDRLSLAAPATLDVGALGKGRLVDLVFDLLAANLDGALVVDGSGDLRVRDRVERVGLEHPYDARRAIGVWTVREGALCASAINRRAWGDGLHHVLDARTGEPVRQIAATWAVAPTAMRADAIATALFFDGGEALAARWGVEWMRMTTAGRAEWSAGCDAEVFR